MSSIQEQFYDFEQEFINAKIMGEPCWHLFRMPIWLEIESHVRDEENPTTNHPDLDIQRKRFFEKAKMAFRMIPSAVLNHPAFLLRNNKKILCMGRYRVSKVDGKWINRELNNVFLLFLKDINYIEKASFEKKENYFKPRTTAKTDYFELIRLKNEILKRYRFSSEDIKVIDTIICKAEFRFNLKLDHSYIVSKLQSSWNGYKTYCKVFDKLIRRINPKVIIEICHYNQTNFATTKIAHKYGINVIELQHGTIGRKHIAYNYPIKDELTPDLLFAYGKAWVKELNFPGKIEIVGNPYLEQSISNYIQNEKKKCVVFISQGPYAEEMVDLAVSLANDKDFIKSGYSIIYKLHPSECLSWKKLHPELRHDRINVIDNDAISLFDCFAKSIYQIGINSTAIYEGIAFGLNTLIIRHRDADELFDVIDREKITFVDNAKQIVDIIINQKQTEITVNELWKENSNETLKNAIERVLF